MVRQVFRKYRMLIVIAVTLFITYLHYSTIPVLYPVHTVYKELYYVPIFLGALVWGLKGAGFVYLMVLIFDVPFIVFGWSGKFAPEVVRLLHLILQGLFAIFAGLIVERERRVRKRAERVRHLAEIGRVATAIVHDLKNPLITVLGFARRLQAGKGDFDTALREITGSALRMQNIVNDVLDFAKPMQLALIEEDVRQVIIRARDALKTKADEAGVRLSTGLPGSPVYANLDGFRMERALVNIISNAVEASKAGQSVFIGAMLQSKQLLIRVKDEGPGMDEETIKNIFVPFYTRKKSGTGLGMPIAQKIVEGHNGRIEIKSMPGAGTEIRIYLPYGHAKASRSN